MKVHNIWKRLTGRMDETHLEDELDFHRSMKEREFLAQGMSPREAGSAARRAMGNLTLAREDSRAEWSFSWLNDIGRDLRYAYRSLKAQPAFTVAAVLALVLGIGVNAILFNIYNALALTPWAVRDADAVVRVFQGDSAWGGFSWPAYRYLRDHSESRFTGYDTNMLQMTRNQATWKISAVEADENFFDVLGTGFAAGRGFSPSNGNLRDPAPEVVLHFDEWMKHFGGDRSVIGEWIELNGRRMQIVGVAADGFSGPVPVSPALWVPAPWRDIFHPGTQSMDNADTCCSKVVARLRDPAHRAKSEAEFDTLLAQYNTDAKRDKSHTILTSLTLLAEPRAQRESTPAFLAMAVAALLILLLACANVANLQLARGVARWREFAVRTSLGATRGRIFRQLLVEAIVLSALAGGLTAVLSAWAPTAIMTYFAHQTSANGRLNFTFANDWRVVLMVTAISLVAALFFGLLPSWTAARSSASAGMQQGGRSTATGRMRSTLLAIQVVLCTILLSGASLLVRALDAAQRADVGFIAERMVVLGPNLDSSGAPEAQTKSIISGLVDRLKTLPEVQTLAHAVVVPLGSRNDSVGVDIPGTKQQIVFAHNRVSANFFEVMGVRMVSGRTFSEADENRKDAMIVNESLARRLWPNESPLGKQLLDGRAIVGVVRDFSIKSIGPGGEPGAFIPSSPSRDSQLLIRHGARIESKAVIELGVKLARTVDKHLSMASAETYTDIVDRSRSVTILIAAVAGVMSGMALLLACVGIYGVAAYSVSQRTREIGVRMALGAMPQSIAKMVLSENLRVVLVGAVIGLAGAVAFGRLLTSMLYGIKPGDPVALLSTIAILLATAGAAAWLPARRAAAVDPAITLRHN